MKNYVLTCLGPSIPTTLFKQITSFLSDMQINIIKTKTLAEKKCAVIEIIINLNTETDIQGLTKNLLQLSTPFKTDIIIQEDNPLRREKKLLIMDMDSTLIQIEVIDELAKEAGIGEAVASITHRAMNGELSFNESLQERVGLLKGLSVGFLKTVYDAIPFTSGAKQLIAILQKLGYKTGVLSGGFDYFTSRVKTSLQLDYAYSNRLAVKDGVLTGEVIGEIVNGDRKVLLLEEIVKREGISLNQSIVIGDGANDLPMIRRAGLGIAFNAKPSVRAAAKHSITQESLLSVLYLLGYSETEIERLSLETIY